jgi:hypothetical protein
MRLAVTDFSGTAIGVLIRSIQIIVACALR